MPAKPDAPFLFGANAEEKDKSRGEKAIRIGFTSVAKATGYEYRLGGVAAGSISNGDKVKIAKSNTLVKIQIRSIGDDGESDWSDALLTMTRPPRPSAPVLELVSLSKFGITLSWSSASAFPGDAQSKFVLYRESTAIGEYELDGTHTDTLYPRGTINSYFGIVKVLEPGVPIAGEVENLSFPSEKLDVAGPVRRIDPTESNNIISVNWETQRQLLRKFGY